MFPIGTVLLGIMNVRNFFLLMPLLLLAETPLEQFHQRTMPLEEAEQLKLFTVTEQGISTLPLYKTDQVHFPVVELQTPNGEKFLALVDTGAGTSVITLPAALRAGVHPVGNPPMQLGARGFGGNTRLWTGVMPALQFGELTLSQLRVGVWGKDRLQGPPDVDGRKIDILLGYDAMMAFDWMEYDPKNKQIRFGEGRPAPLRDAPSIPLDKKRGGGPLVKLSVGSQPDLPVTLDSGGHFGLRFSGADAKRCGIEAANLVAPVQKRKSVGGTSHVVEGPRVKVGFGPVEIQNLRSHIAVDSTGRTDHIGSLLGYPVLSRMHWVLDQEKKQARFEIPAR